MATTSADCYWLGTYNGSRDYIDEDDNLSNWGDSGGNPIAEIPDGTAHCYFGPNWPGIGFAAQFDTELGGNPFTITNTAAIYLSSSFSGTGTIIYDGGLPTGTFTGTVYFDTAGINIGDGADLSGAKFTFSTSAPYIWYYGSAMSSGTTSDKILNGTSIKINGVTTAGNVFYPSTDASGTRHDDLVKNTAHYGPANAWAGTLASLVLMAILGWRRILP